jgi:hypothetical protein
MSIDLAIIDIGRSIFKGAGGYGQIYVALSRVRTLQGLSILNFDPSRIKCHPKVIEFYKRIDESTANTSVLLSPIMVESLKPKSKTIITASKASILNYFTSLPS